MNVVLVEQKLCSNRNWQTRGAETPLNTMSRVLKHTLDTAFSQALHKGK